jgi:hypothetical protein
MAATILTVEDLQEFKKELFDELQKILSGNSIHKPKKWLKSQEVREMLDISPGTLQNLRVSGTLPFTKMGNALYYLYDDIVQILESNKVNHRRTR